MHIAFDLSGAGASSEGSARKREVTRMCCLAWCLSRCGARVTLEEGDDAVTGEPRWKLFGPLRVSSRSTAPDVLISTERRRPSRLRGRSRLLVGYKTSKEVKHDSTLLGAFNLLIAHEFDTRVSTHPQLFVVPWGLNERTITGLENDGLFPAYLENDLGAIRSHYDTPLVRRVGFCGVSLDGRGAHGERLTAANPGWFHFEWAPNQNAMLSSIFGSTYLRWMRGCEAILNMPGDSPKSQRLCDAALIGRPIVYIPIPLREDPPLTERNAIVLSGYDDAITLPRRWPERQRLQEQADRDYLNGWSYMGQAQRLIERLKEML